MELSSKGQTMNQILEDGAKKAKKTMKKRGIASPKKSRKKDKGEEDGKEEKLNHIYGLILMPFFTQFWLLAQFWDVTV